VPSSPTQLFLLNGRYSVFCQLLPPYYVNHTHQINSLTQMQVLWVLSYTADADQIPCQQDHRVLCMQQKAMHTYFVLLQLLGRLLKKMYEAALGARWL
jgi:hypothetical protein